ncbi:hypothetical protein ElyMa_004003400 [Elysia marginata]|uniref:Uncharacterized protein n=1 Tax=Elysia marginata TaxID=1093978 RepID=A0AAV4FZH9_9GAST|nr:hypothetical protein ElyMa_004003400 [Elysia marginata]
MRKRLCCPSCDVPPMDCYFVAVVGLVYSIDLDGDTIQDAIAVEQLMERSQTRCNPLLPCSSPLVWQRLTEKTVQKSQRAPLQVVVWEIFTCREAAST